MTKVAMMIKNTMSYSLLLVLMLSGCGLTQSVTDGTKSFTKAIFYRQVKTLHLDFVGRAGLNPDDDGTPLATKVWVCQLRDRQAFDKADYSALLSDACQLPESDLLAAKEVWVRPGSQMTFDMPLDKSTQFVAVVAQFRTPDNPRESWRLVLARSDLDPDKARVVELNDNRLILRSDSR